MNSLHRALWAETLKARRSRVSLATGAGFALLPVIGGLFMVILKDPERARAMGLIGAKAQLLSGGVADWPTYLQFLMVGTAAGGAILFAFITAWVFGREFSDHTAKELLAVPTPREVIVGTKFVLIALWIMGLTVFVYVVGLVVGSAVGMPGWSLELAWRSFWALMATAGLTLMLMPLVAFFASMGRGYLPPLAWAFATLALAQVAGVLGWGDRFPWSVPAQFSLMFSVMYGQRSEPTGIHSYLLVLVAFIAGMVGTFQWWRSADQTR
jgi:ABC-2 type transport system permease protein